jgi:hypothetical protein
MVLYCALAVGVTAAALADSASTSSAGSPSGPVLSRLAQASQAMGFQGGEIYGCRNGPRPGEATWRGCRSHAPDQEPPAPAAVIR